MASLVIVLIIAVVFLFAFRGSLRHFRGEGGCCGGGGGMLPEEKTLEGPVIAKKIVHVEGMHCENCKNRVERAINRIDGAAAKVNLGKKIAVVSCDRGVPDEQIRAEVEAFGYTVTAIEDK